MPRLTHAALGAQVLRAHAAREQDFLYLSPLSLGQTRPARGGVPVLFPQFADHGPLPRHGFARNIPWTLQEETVADKAHNLRYVLKVTPGQFVDWPHAAHLLLQAQISAEGLHLSLHVTNTGTSSFAWSGGLHPYFAVDDLQACRLSGLAGLPAQDRYDTSLRTQTQEPLHWNGQVFERLYDGCPPVTLSSGSRRLMLSASGFDQWMVWNPGQAGGDALADLPQGDWRRFVCIEPVCVARPVMLAPGQAFVGTLEVQVHTPC